MSSQENTRPTDSQIDIMLKDWLYGTRDENTFIHKNTEGTIEHHLKQGEYLSSYFVRNMPKDETVTPELLNRTRLIAQMVVNSMTDKRIKVVLGGPDSYTDGQSVCIATEHFDKPMPLGKKIDILTGYAVHEAAHIKYTDMTVPMTDARYSSAENRLRKNIINILEDERIEHIVGEDTPGLSDFLGETKDYIWNTAFSSDKTVKPQNKTIGILQTLLYAIRYPARLTREAVAKDYDYLLAIRNTLSKFPESTKEVAEKADSILEIIKELLAKEPEPDKQKNDNNSGNNQQNGNGASSNGQQQENEQTKSPEQKLDDALNSEEGKELMEKMEKLSENSCSKKYSPKNAKCLKNSHDREVANGTSDAERGSDGKTRYIRKVKGDAYNYNKSREAVKKYVPAMRRALSCQFEERDYELYGFKSGKLNHNKLASIRTGKYDIFSKQGEISTDGASVCLLIDESGSMSGEKLQQARNAAVLVNEALKDIENLEYFAYGYQDNELNIYKERNNSDKFGLGSTKADGGTPTGDAMKLASQRIRKMTSTPCLMLVLTDGAPNDSLKVREQDKLLEKNDFIVVGIGISGCKAVEKDFKKSIVISNMQTFAPEIGKIVRKTLAKRIIQNESL